VPKPQPPGPPDTTQTPVGQLTAGASIAAAFTGVITTASASAPIVTLDDGSGSATLPGSFAVTVRSDAVPTALGSAIRASVNGNPVETLVLLPDGWRAADGLHAVPELSQVRVVYLAPPVLVHAPGAPS
jgi:hypothetical protein